MLTHYLDVLMTWTVVAALVVLGVYASDREPPYELKYAPIPAAVPGEPVTFYATVRRDLSRHCAVNMHRSIYHSNGVREDIPSRFFSAEDIARQERETPGRMAPTVQVPPDAVPGQTAYLATTLLYECNQAHRWFKPIEVTTVMPFVVRAP